MVTYLPLIVLMVTAAAAAADNATCEEERFRPEIRYVQGLIKRINNLCGVGVAPVFCHCDTDPTLTIATPLIQGTSGFLLIRTCLPNYCRCPSGEEIDSRPKEMRQLVNLCPRDQLESCLCAANNTRAYYPFDLQTVFFDCRPYKCRCKNDPEEKVVTHFGCANGGIAYCNDISDMWCSDKVVTRDSFLHAKLDRKCMCADGRKPNCRSHGGLPKCPDGQELDYSFAGIEPAFRLCQ